MKEEILVNQTLKGTGVSSGITMGRVRLIDRDKVSITKRSISPRQAENEVGRIRNAVQGAIDQLSHIKDSIPDDDVRKHAFIIDAHILILQDPFFVDSVIDVIRSEHIKRGMGPRHRGLPVPRQLRQGVEDPTSGRGARTSGTSTRAREDPRRR